jgi:hypothetical protein
MILLIVMATIVFVGLTAIALAEPRKATEIVAWNDDLERRLLREHETRNGWW